MGSDKRGRVVDFILFLLKRGRTDIFGRARGVFQFPMAQISIYLITFLQDLLQKK